MATVVGLVILAGLAFMKAAGCLTPDIELVQKARNRRRASEHPSSDG